MKYFIPIISVYVSICVLLGTPTESLARDSKKEEYKKLLQEVEMLRQKKQSKLEELETKEAFRWQERYKQSVELKSLEDKSNSLNAQYSRLAEDLTRKQETKLQAEERTGRFEDDLEERHQVQERFFETVQQQADKIADKLSQDFPYNLSARTLLLSQVSVELSQNKDMPKGLNALFQERVSRLEMTQTQSLETKATLWEGTEGGEKTEQAVWQMRLGTLMLYDLAKESEQKQALLRTGALQGKIFTWRGDITDDFASAVSKSIYAGLSNESKKEYQNSVVPMDVLQNRGIGMGYTKSTGSGFFAGLFEWFGKGGLVMYPLFLCAIAAFLLALERFVIYRRREQKLKHTKDVLLPMIHKKNYAEALNFCKEKDTGLAKAIAAIIYHRNSGRGQAEKSVKEALAVEIPFLEKRLPFISALGASAPLLGLLGTVSGMITLFKVITDVGTNDARILAGGISEALVTTQTGLIIAIPILLLHGYLSEKLDGITSSLQEVSLDTLNSVWPEENAERKESQSGVVEI